MFSIYRKNIDIKVYIIKMETELIALISLLGMIVLCSGMLAIIKSGRLCNISRITPLVGECSRNVPPAENPDVLENV
jgi:hypothetical protein